CVIKNVAKQPGIRRSGVPMSVEFLVLHKTLLRGNRPVLKLNEHPSDFAVEILTELSERPPKCRLHLLAFTLADLAEPVVLQICKQGQEKNEDRDDNKKPRPFLSPRPHPGLAVL